MEKHVNSLFQRIISVVLCVVMMMTVLPAPVAAAQTAEGTSETGTVETGASNGETEGTAREVSEPEWILPECDCGSTETELGKHGETCARKVFLEEFCQETAADIFAKWEKLPEECQKYILEYLGKDEADAEKLAELNGYVNAAEEGSEDPTKETEDPTKETEDPTKETEDPTKETEDPTKETEASAEEDEDTAGEDEESSDETVATEETEPENAIFAINRNGKTPLAVVYAASDFQPEGDQFSASQAVMENIIDQMINAGYTEVDGALFCGDYSNIGDTWNSSKTNSVKYNDVGVRAIDSVLKDEDKWGLISNLNKLSSLLSKDNAGDDVVYVQGNHDPVDTIGLDSFGANDTTHYGVFVIHEDYFQWYQNGNGDGNTTDAQTAAKETAEALKVYLQGKVDAKDNRPIFVASHVPLHFGYRTTSARSGDNIYAKYLFDVLNEYGKELNIIFLFGHNHSSTYDDYLGGAAVYLPAGDKVRIPNLGSTTSSTEYTLNFTYMNAGYLGYYGGKCTTKLSSTVFEIYEDKVIVARYGESGAANLKDKGVEDSSRLTPNETVYTNDNEKATITLKTFEEELESPALSSGVLTTNKTATVSVGGVYGKYYTVEWSSSDPSIAEVAASETDSMTATVTAKSTGKVKIFATITEVTNTRAVGDSQTLEMELEVVDVEMVTLAAEGEQTFYVLDTNQDSSSWTADTSKKYVLVSQDKGNPTAGQFMAMYYNAQIDATEGDRIGSNGASKQELNAEPITVMELPINGEKLYAVSTADDSFLWQFRKQGSLYWIDSVHTVDGSAQSLMLSKGHKDPAGYDFDDDGIRMRGATTGASNSSNWKMSNGAGLIAYSENLGMNYAPYYDSIQGDISVYYTQNGDENMGKRIYVYKEKTYTLENPIVAYMKDTSGSVSKGVGLDAGTGDVIYIQSGDQTVTVPVTLNMLSGNFNKDASGTYSGLTVTYAGKPITTNYTLTVNEAATLLKNEGGKFRSTIYRQVEEMVGGRHYLIVDNAEAGEAHAMGTTGTANYSPVSAHNVLIQSFKVDGQTGLYIDSTRYSDEPDNPTDSIIKDQGNVNANISSDDHKAAIRLVWTPTKAVTYVDEDYPTKAVTRFTTTNVANPYWFLTSEYENGRLWSSTHSSTPYAQPVMFWGGSTSVEEEWGYVPTSNSNNFTVRAKEGVVLNKSTNFRLFYNIESYYTGTNTYKNKNFIVTETETASYSPLRRRTWLYEQDDSIDTITARLDDLTGRVTAGCNASAHTGDYVLVETFKTDGSVEQVKVPVRVSMLSGNLNTANAGTYSGLTVTYEGKVISTNYTLVVAAPVPDDYPEFPDEGAVKIDKQLDTSEYDYLNTGAAVINLSVTGIPAQSGVDILFVLDTSSSMYDCIHNTDVDTYCSECGATVNKNTNSRLALLKETMINTLKSLQTPIDGYTPDIDVAVACFNGYTPINSDLMLNYEKPSTGDLINNDITNATQVRQHRIDSSNVSLNFTDVARLTEANIQAAADGLYLNAGTNYDRGMEIAYTMLKAKQERDALNGETRQQILVFMTDGTPYQFNYVHGNSRMNDWNKYLKGESIISAPAESLFADYFNDEGKLWMAEAIKGDPNRKYKIINPDLQESNTKIDSVNGLGATIYTVGMGIYSDNLITEETAKAVIQNIATPDEGEKKYYYPCTEPSHFKGAFTEITNTIRSAGDAVFADQMGTDFDLITCNTKTFTKENGDSVSVTYNPEIVVRQYPLYHRSDIGGTVDGVKVTEAMAGTRRPVDPTVIEIVTFNGDGTAAYSNGDTGTNILKDGVICAKTFWYNTTQNPVQIDTNGDGTTETTLEKECFYWNVGDIPQDELVLTYPVYLTGSMEGTRPAGTYDTNTHAELNYVNYLDHDCELKVPTPRLPWDQATVAYAFYLVDKDGNPIINQTTGITGSFEQSIKITTPVYKDFLLNSDGSSIVAETVSAGEVLPEGYALFDTDASYEVSMNSNGTGYYKIVVGRSDGIQTTFVQGVESTAIKGSGKIVTENFATANTIVWFAVTATVQCTPDTVVIDYGLPVEIDVMANDVLIGYNGTLKYIGGIETVDADYTAAKETNADLKLWQYLQNLNVSQTEKFSSTQIGGEYGEAKVIKNAQDVNGKIRYTLNESNGMQMEKEETFVYAVKYTGSVGTQGYYYSTVTVIPATTIYYEDNFVQYAVLKMADGSKISENWDDAGDSQNKNQGQDRPGEYSLPQVDANNIYGYDSAYTQIATHSLGHAKKVTVNAEQYAQATFTFYGTGFDVISLTSSDTGTILVDVFNYQDYKDNKFSATPVTSQFVDTYYGYKYVKCNVVYEYIYDEDSKTYIWDKNVGEPTDAAETNADKLKTELAESENKVPGKTVEAVEYCWIADQSAANTLYQVPVVKVKGLPYGQYTAVISASYVAGFDHKKDTTNSYDFYLDAIRIYDPANDGEGNKVIEDAYVADGEGWPEYFELRNLIISKKDFNSNENGTGAGVIFIDNTLDGDYDENYSISDYTNYGPNNEVYLAPGQSIAFDLNVNADNLDRIHLAMKSVGNTASVTYYGVTGTTIWDRTEKTIATATDLYYDITNLNGKTVVITNTGEGGAILSITNVKVTYRTEHRETNDNSIESGYLTITQETARAAVASLMMMRPPVVPEEPDVPETTVPETTVPEETVPETTVPEETVPETTVPEETVPETTVPEETEAFEPKRFNVRISDTSVKVGSKVTVTVTTGTDVDYITVNGTRVTKYSGSRYSSTRTWQVRVETEEVGEMDVAVVCYNSEGFASQPVVKTVSVTAKYTSITNVVKDIITGFFDRLWGSR